MGVGELDMFRQVVDADPLNGLALARVLLGLRIPAGILIQLLDLRRTVHFFAVFAVEFRTLRIFSDAHVAVHTNVDGRDVRVLTVLCTAMAIKTVDLVDPCMHRV